MDKTIFRALLSHFDFVHPQFTKEYISLRAFQCTNATSSFNCYILPDDDTLFSPQWSYETTK